MLQQSQSLATIHRAMYCCIASSLDARQLRAHIKRASKLKLIREQFPALLVSIFANFGEE
jgi:hypothetical protein